MPDSPLEIETHPAPDAAVIWLHGLGADGHDFESIVPELPLPDSLKIRFIFPHAPFRPVTCNGGYVMRAWYDVFSLEKIDREDRAGLEEARQTVESLIQQEMERGISADRIILMGFSQGGAVVLFTGLRFSQRLAGIGALSTYLPLASSLGEEKHPANAEIPIFMAHGEYDPVVRFALGEQSCRLIQQQGYNVHWHSYPMEHGVCMEEIHDIAQWLGQQLVT